jgi:hypothetical protein
VLPSRSRREACHHQPGWFEPAPPIQLEYLRIRGQGTYDHVLYTQLLQFNLDSIHQEAGDAATAPFRSDHDRFQFRCPIANYPSVAPHRGSRLYQNKGITDEFLARVCQQDKRTLVQKTIAIEAPSRLPGSIVTCVRRKCRRDALMVMVQAEPEWAKEIEVAQVPMFDPKSRFIHIEAGLCTVEHRRDSAVQSSLALHSNFIEKRVAHLLVQTGQRRAGQCIEVIFDSFNHKSC